MTSARVSEGRGLSPTGKAVSVPGMDIESFDEDGMLVLDRANVDQLDFLSQLGLIPEA
jgi:hypothetical protein